MSLQIENLYRMLCLVAVVQAAQASPDGLAKMRPSDCRPRDADSTCATAVAGAPPSQPVIPAALSLYDGPLAGVPASGYAYWGFDFLADATGTPSLVRPDEFINRSNVPVTITLSFNFPTNHPCTRDCLPGVEFEVDRGWSKIDPPFVISGNTVSVSHAFAPGRGFGWMIGLWQSTNTRLTVSVPAGSAATMQDVGLSPSPAIANEIAAVTRLCACEGSDPAPCSDGSHFSNGLLGDWSQEWDNYTRAGAFTDCLSHR